MTKDQVISLCKKELFQITGSLKHLWVVESAVYSFYIYININKIIFGNPICFLRQETKVIACMDFLGAL